MRERPAFDAVARWLSRPTARRALVKQLAVAAVLGAMVAAITGLISNGKADSYQATARLSLTEEVVWPFFDEVREEQQVRLENSVELQQVADIARQQTQGEVLALTLATPKAQTFLELVASASSGEAAAAGANIAARRLVEADVQAGMAPILAEIADIESAIESLGTATDQETSIQRGTQQARLLDLEQARDNFAPRMKLVRDASVPTSTSRSPGVDGLLAGLLAAAVALVALRVTADRRGVATTVHDAASLAGLETLGDVGATPVENFFLLQGGIVAFRSARAEVDVAPLTFDVAARLQASGRLVAVLSDREGLTGPEDALRRADALDPGELLRVSLHDVEREDFGDPAFPVWLDDLAATVDVVLIATDSTGRGDLLCLCAETLIHVVTPTTPRQTCRGLARAVLTHAGRQLVLRAPVSKAVDLRDAGPAPERGPEQSPSGFESSARVGG